MRADWYFSMELFGRDLKRERQDIGFSQRDLALLLDVSHATISAWERGNSGMNIWIQNLVQVCNLLDLDPRKYFIQVDPSEVTGGGADQLV